MAMNSNNPKGLRKQTDQDIESALELILMERDSCTLADVFDLLGCPHSGGMIRVVVAIAQYMEYRCEFESGRWVIYDW